jgi:hypothetical protein
VYILLIMLCSTISLHVVYMQLCAENHQRWWFSFVAPGSTAVYNFLYSIAWFQRLESSGNIVTYKLYFAYMGLICLGMFLVTGTIGALSSLYLVRPDGILLRAKERVSERKSSGSIGRKKISSMCTMELNASKYSWKK